VAVDVGETGDSQPAELVGEVGEAIGGVVLRAADLAAEALVQLGGGGRDEVEVGKDAAGSEESVDFGEEFALAVVLEVMDREPGDDRVEGPDLRQRFAQVVDPQPGGGSGEESLGGTVEHRLRGVEADAFGLWVGGADEADQTAVAGPKIEDAVDTLGERREQHRLRHLAVGDLPREVLGDALGVGPLLHRDQTVERRRPPSIGITVPVT
jgi:hypothetical protein